MSKKSKTVELDANGHPKFGMRDKLAYAAGDFGCNMSFALKNTVNTFWLVFMFMENNLLGWLVILTQVWDAINDPMLGSIIDRDTRKYRLGKFKTYILVGACGLLVAGALIFIPLPDSIRMSQETRNVVIKSLVFVAAYVIWDACYTIANVPYGSMLSLVTSDKVEQAELSTWRSLGSAMGNVIAMVIPFIIWKDVVYDTSESYLSKIAIPKDLTVDDFRVNPFTKQPYQAGDTVLNPETGENLQMLLGERVFWIALVMGVLGLIAFLFMIKNITLRVDENSVQTNDNGEAIPKGNILKSFGTFFKNRAAVGATIAAMGMFFGMQSASTANTIMFTIHFGNAQLATVVMIVGFAPMFLFMPFIKKIVSKYGKKEASVAGAITSCVGGLLMFLFPIVPEALSLPVLMISLVIFGLGMGIYTCVSWAMMGDAIDYHEWRFHKREEGTVYAIHSFFRKLAQGLGPALVLFIMGMPFIGYDASRGIAQTAETAQNLCWLVAGLYFFSAICQFVGLALVYNLDKKTVAVMQEQLAERHDAENN